MSIKDTKMQVQINFKEKNLSFNSRDSNLEINKDNKHKGNIKPEVIQKLMHFGFELDQIIITHKTYKFTDVEEACFLMLKDPETNLYNHKFFPYNESNSERDFKNPKRNCKGNNIITDIEEYKCKICKGKLTEHNINENLDHSVNLDINLNNNPIIANCLEKVPDTLIAIDVDNDNNNKNNENHNGNKSKNTERRFSLIDNIKKVSNNSLKFSVINKKISDRIISNNLQIQNYQQINETSISTKLPNFNIKESFINLNMDRKNTNSNIENKNDSNDFDTNLEKCDTLIKSNKEEIIGRNVIDNIKNYKSNVAVLNNEDNNNKTNNNFNIKKNNNIKNNIIKSNYIVPDEILEFFNDPDICKICFSNKINEKNKVIFDCGHFFCCNCVSTYLTTNINQGKVIR
jgi:hypothetical protein